MIIRFIYLFIYLFIYSYCIELNVAMAEASTVTARKAIDQRCSESNGLPIDEDTKLKKRKTFRRKTRYIYYQRLYSLRVLYIFRILIVTTKVTPRPHAKAVRQTCLASENLPVKDIRNTRS